MNTFVYMVRCADGTLYTGWTTNVERRVRNHNTDKGGAKYTRWRRPVTLAWSAPCSDNESAMALEWRVKRLSRRQKEELIKNE